MSVLFFLLVASSFVTEQPGVRLEGVARAFLSSFGYPKVVEEEKRRGRGVFVTAVARAAWLVWVGGLLAGLGWLAGWRAPTAHASLQKLSGTEPSERTHLGAPDPDARAVTPPGVSATPSKTPLYAERSSGGAWTGLFFSRTRRERHSAIHLHFRWPQWTAAAATINNIVDTSLSRVGRAAAPTSLLVPMRNGRQVQVQPRAQ